MSEREADEERLRERVRDTRRDPLASPFWNAVDDLIEWHRQQAREEGRREGRHQAVGADDDPQWETFRLYGHIQCDDGSDWTAQIAQRFAEAFFVWLEGQHLGFGGSFGCAGMYDDDPTEGSNAMTRETEGRLSDRSDAEGR